MIRAEHDPQGHIPSEQKKGHLGSEHPDEEKGPPSRPSAPATSGRDDPTARITGHDDCSATPPSLSALAPTFSHATISRESTTRQRGTEPSTQCAVASYIAYHPARAGTLAHAPRIAWSTRCTPPLALQSGYGQATVNKRATAARRHTPREELRRAPPRLLHTPRATTTPRAPGVAYAGRTEPLTQPSEHGRERSPATVGAAPAGGAKGLHMRQGHHLSAIATACARTKLTETHCTNKDGPPECRQPPVVLHSARSKSTSKTSQTSARRTA